MKAFASMALLFPSQKMSTCLDCSADNSSVLLNVGLVGRIYTTAAEVLEPL